MTIYIDEDVYKKARRLGINISQFTEEALKRAILKLEETLETIEQGGGARVWSKGADSRSVGEGLPGFESRPPHFSTISNSPGILLTTGIELFSVGLRVKRFIS